MILTYLKLAWQYKNAVIITALLAVCGYFYYSADNLRKDLQIESQNFDLLKKDYDHLRTLADMQNQAVLKQSEEARKQLERANKAYANYKLLQAKYKKTLEGIDNVTYDPKVDDCANTRNLLNRLQH